jgi:O-antigen/teichoic acid export membrane protein
MQLSDRTRYFVLATAAMLPLLAVAVLLWRRFYRDDAGNTARRVVKNSAVPLVFRLMVRAFDLAVFVVLQQTLPGVNIGPYALAVLLVGQYLGTFTEFGLGVLLTREVARDPGAARRLFGTTLLLRWALVLCAAAPFAALLIGLYGALGALGLGEAVTPVGQQAIWVLLLTLIPGAYSSAVTALYNASERMEVPALVEVITAIVGLGARLALLWSGFGILALAWAAVGVTTGTATIYLWLQNRDFFRPTLRWDSALARQLLPLAFPLMLNNLLNVVFFRFDTFIIKAFGAGRGDLMVTQYDIAYKVISVATILPPIVTFAVFPLFARRAAEDRAALAQAQNRTLQALLLVAFPIAMGMSVLATPLVLLINGRNAAQYLPISAQVLAILAWFLPLSFANGLLQYVLIAVNRQRAITRAFAIGAAFNLAANLLLVPWYGLYAASAITILSEVVLFAVFRPLLRGEGLDPPLLALAWRPALATVLMGGAMLACYDLGPPGLASALVAPPVYLAALWALGAYGAEERALVRRVLGRA